MLQRGKLLICGIFILALFLSCFSVWWHYQQGDRAKRFWGGESALLIRHAPYVEVLRFSDQGEAALPAEDKVVIGSKILQVVARKDISRIPGLLHARHALIEDASFFWDTPPDACDPHWQYGLRFIDGDRRATVLLDYQCGYLRLATGRQLVAVRPRVLQGLQGYTVRQIGDSDVKSGGAGASQ